MEDNTIMHWSSVVGQAEKYLLSGCHPDSYKVTRTRSLSERVEVFGENDRKGSPKKRWEFVFAVRIGRGLSIF